MVIVKARRTMKYKKKLKRVADALEKMGVAGIAVALFQGKEVGPSVFFAAFMCLLVSIYLTED